MIKVDDVYVSVGHTFNIGNYESVKVEVGLGAKRSLEDTDTYSEVVKTLQTAAHRQMMRIAEVEIESRRPKKEEKEPVKSGVSRQTLDRIIKFSEGK